MRISVTRFGGIEPKTDPSKLSYDPESGYCKAQTAQNCDLTSGSFKPLDNEAKDTDASLETTVLTLYRYLSQYWLEWAADVDVAPGPIAADTANKIYYTGDGIPKKTNETEATTGSGAMPINYYPMAVPTPLAAPSATATGSGGTGDDRNISYKWTVVTSWGEEGKPSPASTVVAAMNGETVDLTGMTLVWQASTAYTKPNWVVPASIGNHVYKCVQAGTTGSAEPTWPTTIGERVTDGTVVWECVDKGILYDSGVKYIYRTNTGDTSATWQYVASIAMSATTYSDSITDTNLGEVCPSDDWDPPDDDLSGLISCGNFYAAFKGKDVYFSEPNYPHAWPSKYSFSVPDTIVALGNQGTTTIILTDGHTQIADGNHPESKSPAKVAQMNPCLAKRGAISTQYGVAFPSIGGLALNNGEEETVVTKDIYTRKQWAALYPSTWHAVMHEGNYIGFYSSGGTEGGVVIPLSGGEPRTLNFCPNAAAVDPDSGKLYYTKSTDAVLLMIGGTSYPSQDSVINLIGGGDDLLLI